MCSECPKCIYDSFHFKNIKKYLACDETVDSIGYYDIQDENIENNTSTNHCEFIKNKNGSNILALKSKYVKDKLENNFLNEMYNITSYSSDCECNKGFKKINGMISFNGLYYDESEEGMTKSDIVKFPVVSANGIYKGLTSVIIDFTSNIRKMYFIKEKIKCEKYNKNNHKHKKQIK